MRKWLRLSRVHACLLCLFAGFGALLAQASPPDSLTAENYFYKGEAFLESGAMDSAIHFIGLATEIYDELDSMDYYLNATTALAVAHYYTGDLAGARSVLEKADTRLQSSSRAPADYQQVLFDLLGPVYEAQGDMEKALETTLASLDLMEGPENPEQRATLLNNVGAIYFSKGDYTQAIDYYQAAVEHYEGKENLAARARALVNLGLAEMRQHRFKKAEKTLDRALELVGDQRSPQLDKTAILGRNHLALCHIELDFPRLSVVLLELNLVKYDLSPKDEALVRANLGFALVQKGDTLQALDELEKAIALGQEELSPAQVATIYLHLGEARLGNQDYQASYEAFSTGIQLICDETGLQADQIRSQTDPNGAASASRIQDKRNFFRLLAGRGRLGLFMQAPDHNPIRDFRDAFFTMDLMRSELITPSAKEFLASYVHPLNDDAMALFSELYPDDPSLIGFGFEVLERRKALNLLEDIVLGWHATLSPESKAQLEAARKVQHSLNLYQRSLFQAEQNEDEASISLFRSYVLDLREELRSLNAPLKAQAGLQDFTQAGMDLEQLQQQAREQQTHIIAYGLADTIFMALSVGPDTVNIHQAVGEKEVESIRQAGQRFATLVSDWEGVQAGGAEVLKGLVSSGRALYQEILAPLLSDSDALPLVIIPDGVLNFIPFEALLTGEEGLDQGYASLPYLIRQRELSYAYSGTLWLQQQARPKSRVQNAPLCLAFAPSQDNRSGEQEPLRTLRNSKANLPGARKEVQALAKAFEGHYFFGQEATEKAFVDSVRQQRHDLIHLAMHGIIDPEHSEYSYLAFEPDHNTPETDGKLEDFEVRQLDFSKARMVVLSACETGRGEYIEGEGVMSLGRSFVQGGAESVVISLWKLEDGASAQLMEYFYQSLKKGGSKSAALRQAKLQYLEEADDFYAHPAFWAGYVLLGETAPLMAPPASFPSWVWMVLGAAILFLGGIWFFRRHRPQS